MQVEHKTEKGILSFILAPNDATGYKLESNTLTFDIKYGVGKVSQDVLPGLKLIGLTSEVKEEQASMMVDSSDRIGLIGGYIDYRKHQLNLAFNTAIGSLKSLMQHLPVYEVNPFGKHPPLTQLNSGWEEAESRTGKWIVLFKPD